MLLETRSGVAATLGQADLFHALDVSTPASR
jgi:hypothetical protein